MGLVFVCAVVLERPLIIHELQFLLHIIDLVSVQLILHKDRWYIVIVRVAQDQQVFGNELLTHFLHLDIDPGPFSFTKIGDDLSHRREHLVALKCIVSLHALLGAILVVALVDKLCNRLLGMLEFRLVILHYQFFVVLDKLVCVVTVFFYHFLEPQLVA